MIFCHVMVNVFAQLHFYFTIAYLVYAGIYLSAVIYLFIFADPAPIDWLHSVVAERDG